MDKALESEGGIVGLEKARASATGSKQEKNAVAVGKTTFAERVRIFQSLTGKRKRTVILKMFYRY